jgi:hypothetical protein
MSNEKLTMTNLYKRLQDIGFTREFIKCIGLPSWWVDEIDNIYNDNIPVIYEASGYISQRIFLDLKSILDPNQEIKFIRGMSYEKVIKHLRTLRGIVRDNLILEKDITNLSDDTIDYYQQLVNLKL